VIRKPRIRKERQEIFNLAKMFYPIMLSDQIAQAFAKKNFVSATELINAIISIEAQYCTKNNILSESFHSHTFELASSMTDENIQWKNAINKIRNDFSQKG